MHVVIVEVKVDPDRMAHVRQFLNDVIAPRAQEFAGFKAGDWLRSLAGDAGRSLLFFESGDAARAAANEIQTYGVPEGMPAMMEGIETFEVLVQAQPPGHHAPGSRLGLSQPGATLQNSAELLQRAPGSGEFQEEAFDLGDRVTIGLRLLRVLETRREASGKEPEPDLLESARCGGHLRHNVAALTFLSEHLLDAAHLSFDAPKPALQFTDDFGTDLHRHRASCLDLHDTWGGIHLADGP